MNTALLLWGVLISSIGIGYFIYGKKQKAPVPLACGIALMVFPYFITSVTVLLVVAVILLVLPAFVRI